MKIFLKIKHWQVFILQVILPLSGILYFIFKTVLTSINASDLNTDFVLDIAKTNFMLVLPILLFVQAFHLLHFLSMGLAYQHKLSYNYPFQKLLFIGSLFFPLVVSGFIMYYLGGFYLEMITKISALHDQAAIKTELGSINSGIKFISPLSILNLVFYAFAYYYIAKALKSAEMKKEAEIGDFAIEMVWLYFYIVGMWILQPRFNKLIKGDNKSAELGNETSERFKPKL